MQNVHILLRSAALLTVLVALLIAGAGCSSDDSSSIDAGVDAVSEDTSNSDTDAENVGACPLGEWKNHASDSCEACPATPVACDTIDLEASSVNPSTNLLEVVLEPGKLEAVEVRASGIAGDGGGFGGGIGGGQGQPVSDIGSVDGDRLSFDFSAASAAEEISISKLTIVESCSGDQQSANLTVKWEPDGSVTAEPNCLPPLPR
jgi:hypothetical protein